MGQTQGDSTGSGLTDASVKAVADTVNTLMASLGKTYERLPYSGFVSALGALLVLVPLILGRVASSIAIDEQRLYVISGAAFVLIGTLWITIQNLFVYKLHRLKQEIACRMLAIKVAAMGEIQREALLAIGEAQTVQPAVQKFQKR